MAPRSWSLEAAVALVQPVDTLAIPLGPGIPASFMHALAARDDWQDLRVFGALLIDLFEVFTKPGVHFTSGFFGPAERFLRDAGADVQFLPADFRRFAPMLEQMRPRVMATIATPPDAEGWCSLSIHAGATVDALHDCGADPDRVLIVEMNPRFPRTFGLLPDHGHRLHIDEIDVLVEGDREPMHLAEDVPSAVELAIAQIARGFVVDGSTLQTGIGGIPSAVATLLSTAPGGEYGVHSEMFTTGLMRLHQAGKITNRRKGQFIGFSVTTFAAGIPELYEFLDGNEEVRFLPVEIVNSPHVIAANHAMVMINGAVAVDLAGQVAADTVGRRQYSGIGGAEDFAMPSGLQIEDRSLICLPSTVTVTGAAGSGQGEGRVASRILSSFGTGTIITMPRHQVDVVITEYGAAELRGRTVIERAKALAAIAHPDFREALLDDADQAGN